MRNSTLRVGVVISVPPEDRLTGNPFAPLLRLVWRYAGAHWRMYDRWLNGKPVHCWYDVAGNICIKYESGAWWHYRVTKKEGLEWW